MEKKITQMPGPTLEKIDPDMFKQKHIDFVVQNACQLWVDQGRQRAVHYLFEYARSEWFDEIVDIVIERMREYYGVPTQDCP